MAIYNLGSLWCLTTSNNTPSLDCDDFVCTTEAEAVAECERRVKLGHQNRKDWSVVDVHEAIRLIAHDATCEGE